MKRSDISDREALEACWGWGESDNRGGAVQVLQRAGWPFKVVVAKLEHLCDRDLIDYGVSLNFPWRTPTGEETLARGSAATTHVHSWQPVGTVNEKKRFYNGITNPLVSVTLAITTCECGAIRRTEVTRSYLREGT